MRASGIIVHHTDSSQASTTIEAVRRWHLALGWSGVGYHFFIDALGRIWQGRPLGVVGAHTYGHNADALRRTYTIGVALAGNFERERPTAAQLRALVVLGVWLSYTQGFPYHHVKGHRDYLATLCPGLFLYSELRSVRNQIYAGLAKPVIAPTIYK